MAMEAGNLAVCLPFLLEAGYSGRSGDDHSTLLADAPDAEGPQRPVGRR